MAWGLDYDVEDWTRSSRKRPSRVTRQQIAELAAVSNPVVDHTLRDAGIKAPFKTRDLESLLTVIHEAQERSRAYGVINLCKRLHVDMHHMWREYRDGRFAPDIVVKGDPRWYRRNLKEVTARWRARKSLYPGWAKEKAVITPFGMIRPRAEPDVKVLAQILLMTPLPHSGRFSRKVVNYNFRDLHATQFAKRSMIIYENMSRRGLLTPRVSGRRRNTSSAFSTTPYWRKSTSPSPADT